MSSIASSEDYEVLSTDGSEAGDASPRLETRSISHPISPLARDNSVSSFTSGENDCHSYADGKQITILAAKNASKQDSCPQQGHVEGQNRSCQGQNGPLSCQSLNGSLDECHPAGQDPQIQVKFVENGFQKQLHLVSKDSTKALLRSTGPHASDASTDHDPREYSTNHQVWDQRSEPHPNHQAQPQDSV